MIEYGMHSTKPVHSCLMGCGMIWASNGPEIVYSGCISIPKSKMQW